MNTQAIIIYRNPLEQQFWESGMMFNLLVFMVMAIALIWSSARIIEYFFSRRTTKVALSGSLTFVAIVLSVAVSLYVAFIWL